MTRPGDTKETRKKDLRLLIHSRNPFHICNRTVVFSGFHSPGLTPVSRWRNSCSLLPRLDFFLRLSCPSRSWVAPCLQSLHPSSPPRRPYPHQHPQPTLRPSRSFLPPLHRANRPPPHRAKQQQSRAKHPTPLRRLRPPRSRARRTARSPWSRWRTP